MTQASEISSSVVKSSEVIGVNVENSQNEKLGKIEELVIDKLNGNVRYAVLSFSELLGIVKKLFAIPWELLEYDNKRKCFVINVPKDKLKNANGFDKDNWPNMADEKWNKAVRDYYIDIS
ncbi:MAG: PRC-barrel protein [Gammaproteobacteria bacterium]|jgi:sporulation protein YlmC with PRC-barrel domain|nr:PRC-barrel protein [Gammaproteobacteria bacterium]